MSEARIFRAASVPRFLRQTALSYLPLNFIIGSRVLGGADTKIVYDVVMLPRAAFARMKSNIGLQHVIMPHLSPGGSSFSPVFVLADEKEYVASGPLPEAEARAYFQKAFGLDEDSLSERFSLAWVELCSGPLKREG